MSDDLRQPESLLPYERWTEEALREVVVRALEHAAAEGLPGEHHFYLTFRTDHPDARLPGHLKARYPQEMTIVLQHRFEALTVDRGIGQFSVRLFFGGMPATLVVPISAMTAFADPHVRYGLRFEPEVRPANAAAPAQLPEAPAAAASAGAAGAGAGGEGEATAPAQDAAGQVVRLDTFRRRPGRE
jgi:hypothetical protein